MSGQGTQSHCLPQRDFEFTPAALTQVRLLVEQYPTKQSALLPVLWIAQAQVLQEANRPRKLTHDVIRAVARTLGLSPAYVWGVATFYTMFHTNEVGEHLLEVCTSVACTLVGGEELFSHICQRLGLDPAHGGTTADGRFTVRRAECLAACGYAPMLQLDEGPYHEHLTLEAADRLLEQLGVPPRPAGETPALPGRGRVG